MFPVAPLQYKQCTQAAATQVRTGKALFCGLTVNSSTSGTITVYDNTSAAGTVIFTKASLAAGEVIHLGGAGIQCNNGIHVVIDGTATVNVLVA